MRKFYITTSIMYTNGPAHVGFAMELIQADVIARYRRLAGDDVFFLSGTDEHGSTVARAAAKNKIESQTFVDSIAKQVKDLAKKLNISNNDFIRTSDQKRHWPSAVKLWQLLADKGDLYKKKYKGLYCVGHESFVKKGDLVDGLCPLHKTQPEEIEEENWFFKLSNYKKEIKTKIESDEIKIVPASRKSEILNVVEDAEDISVSRPTSALTWGIPVPGDPGQRIWVWLDALPNYISALGYAQGDARFKKFWPADVHLVGKDIVRFHALIWPAILLSAGLELPRSIYVHGFITVDGQKMSKTIGNIIDPLELVKKYGVDPVRYFLLREIASGEDGDFSYKKLEERYNGDLANGLGNLIQRIATLIENNLGGELIYKEVESKKLKVESGKYEKAIEEFRLHDALGEIWKLVIEANKYVDDRKPWAEAKESPERFLETLAVLVGFIHNISWLLQPFLPETAQKIAEVFGDDLSSKEIPENCKFLIKKSEGLFPRLN